MFVVRMYPLDVVPTDSSDGAVLLSRLPYFGNPHSRRRSRSRRERFAVLHAGVGRNDNVRRTEGLLPGVPPIFYIALVFVYIPFPLHLPRTACMRAIVRKAGAVLY